ncbi:MAG: beta-lactamase family protein [Defluviitaleaceae bacterium]|nr:beta-lactamase family protein [Defluviitaleaceae bacterium]MCL2835630.1 beta-lactamase family protein [Defluviitaleaceae bacterium]
MDIAQIWNEWHNAKNFSGVFSARNELGVVFEECRGFRNRNESLLNNRDTAFGIASGTKMFTGLAVCKLIDDKKLTLDSRICDLLRFDLGRIDERVTVFHLLTHTSGIGDYIDEETEDSMGQLQMLYNRYPVYLWERLEYYLPMITPLPPKFEPGARFGYSNAGYVLLGLVAEAVSGLSYQQYVRDAVIAPCGLAHTGFYRMDALPANTALGYMGDENGEWRTNIFNMPVIGGADGGLFTCADDLDKLWRAVFSNKVLSEEMTKVFLKPHVSRNGDDDGCYYGLGVYINGREDGAVYFAVGGDSGVDFFTAYVPGNKTVISALGNSEINTYPLLEPALR